MKYVVQVKYTNPAHEHVSLRRRVETVNRIVEAATEQEAINRVANQQRSLGFFIKEATVHKDPDHVDMTPEDPKDKEKKKGVVGDDNEQTMVRKEPVKENVATAQKVADRAAVVAKTADDSKKRLAASFLARKAQLRTINPTGVNTGIDRGAGNKATRKMGGIPKYQLDLDKKKTSVSEEAELEEARKMSRVEWRMGTETDVDKNNKKIYDKLAARDPAKAKAFHDNLMRMKKKDAKEKIEEARPMSAPAYSSVSAKILTGKTGTNFGYAPNKMPPHLKAAQAASDALSKVAKRPQAGTLAAARGMKEEAVKEPPKSLVPTPKQNPDQKTTLSPSNPVVQKDDKLKEATETAMNRKKSKVAAKAVKAAKGKVNKVNLEPTAEIAPTHAHALSMNGKF